MPEPEDRTDSSDLRADLKGARWALDYLLFEDGQSKNLSVHGAMCLDLIRRYIEDQEKAEE